MYYRVVEMCSGERGKLGEVRGRGGAGRGVDDFYCYRYCFVFFLYKGMIFFYFKGKGFIDFVF